MARAKRKLPKDVYVYRENLVYWPYLGNFNGIRKRGKRIFLGAPGMPESKIYRLLDQIKETKRRSVEWLLSTYMGSEKFSKLSKSTRHNRKEVYYTKNVNRCGPKNGVRFGDILLASVTPPMLLRVLESFEGNGTRSRHSSVQRGPGQW